MPLYSVIFKPSVEKDLRSLPQSVVARVFKLVEELKDEPFRVSQSSWQARSSYTAYVLAIIV